MPKSRPYQPLIFRGLHTLNGFTVLSSMVTGFWMYNTWDRRFGWLPLPMADNQLLDIHHQIGEVASAFFAVFLLYSLFAGQRRLLQVKSLRHLLHLDEPSGQYALHRSINTGLLGMLILSMISARQFGGAKAMINEEWGNVWYNLHVFAWASMVVLVTLHLTVSFKVGGFPLWQSVFDWRVRTKDSPKQWPQKLKNWLGRLF